MTDSRKSVLLFGYGAIGRQLVDQFPNDELRWTAVVRDVDKHADAADHGVELHQADRADVAELIGEADVVVECAGVQPARQVGPQVIAADTDLVLTSVGALADPDVAASLLDGPGRLHVTSGAIGGFDVLAAAAEAGGLDHVAIETRKLGTGLVQPWMTDEQASLLRGLKPGDEPVTVFTGDPIDAIDGFPGNVNVSVALAWATRGGGLGDGSDDATLLERSLSRVHVELIADPAAELSRHRITASGAAGTFEMTFESAPSPVNPKTSGLTALADAHTLRQALRTD